MLFWLMQKNGPELQPPDVSQGRLLGELQPSIHGSELTAQLGLAHAHEKAQAMPA